MPKASSKKKLSEILSEIRKRGEKPGGNVRIERATWKAGDGGMGSTPACGDFTNAGPVM